MVLYHKFYFLNVFCVLILIFFEALCNFIITLNIILFSFFFFFFFAGVHRLFQPVKTSVSQRQLRVAASQVSILTCYLCFGFFFQLKCHLTHEAFLHLSEERKKFPFPLCSPNTWFPFIPLSTFFPTV